MYQRNMTSGCGPRVAVCLVGLLGLVVGCSEGLPGLDSQPDAPNRGQDAATDGPLTRADVSVDGPMAGQDAAADSGEADASTRTCLSNGGCNADQFCKKVVHPCDDDMVGVCRPKPTDCPAASELVCGCDRLTYQNVCAAYAAGQNVWQTNRCENAQCDELEQDYQQTILTLKECDPESSEPSCTNRLEQGSLGCACPTYVNFLDGQITAVLADLQAAWDGAGCVAEVTCSCANLAGGECRQKADGHSCTDIVSM